MALRALERPQHDVRPDDEPPAAVHDVRSALRCAALAMTTPCATRSLHDLQLHRLIGRRPGIG